jgi:cytochrome oxidase assembly protein ShyY1
MSYLIKLIKSLPILLMVLVLHALALWQVIQHKSDRNVVQQPKTMMVHIITPAPIVKKPPSPKKIIKPIIKKRVKPLS